MPIIKSAIKRVRQEKKRRVRNTVTKTKYKVLIKEFLKLVSDKKTAEAIKLFPQVQKAIDMACKKNLLPKNTAARKKSGLVKMIAKENKVTPKTVKAKTEEKPAKKVVKKSK